MDAITRRRKKFIFIVFALVLFSHRFLRTLPYPYAYCTMEVLVTQTRELHILVILTGICIPVLRVLYVGFSRGIRKWEGGKMCDNAYVREREETVLCPGTGGGSGVEGGKCG